MEPMQRYMYVRFASAPAVTGSVFSADIQINAVTLYACLLGELYTLYFILYVLQCAVRISVNIFTYLNRFLAQSDKIRQIS